VFAQEAVFVQKACQDAFAQEAFPQEVLPQEASTQEAFAQLDSAQEAFAQELFTQGPFAQETFPQEAFVLEAFAQEALPAQLPVVRPPDNANLVTGFMIAQPAAASDNAPFVSATHIPSLGSSGHAQGTCKPCAFLHKQGCENGVACPFCHICESGEKRRRQREKKAILKARNKDSSNINETVIELE